MLDVQIVFVDRQKQLFQYGMNNHTLEKMRQMRLFGMHDAFKTSPANTIKEKMTQDGLVSHPVNSEWDNRKNRAVERAVRASSVSTC